MRKGWIWVAWLAVVVASSNSAWARPDVPPAPISLPSLVQPAYCHEDNNPSDCTDMGLLLFFSVAKKGAEEVDKRTCPEACLYLEQTVGALEDIYCNFGLQPCPPPPMLPECSDGLDNDGDAFVDYPADPDCTSPWDDDEEGFFPVPLPWP